MKSLVLCERTLVQESKTFSTLKDGKMDEDENEKADKKVKLNGIPESKKSETVIKNFEGSEKSVQNESSGTLFKEIDENDRKPLIEQESVASFTMSEADNTRNSLSSEGRETDCSVSQETLSETKTTGDDEQDRSVLIDDLKNNSEEVVKLKQCDKVVDELDSGSNGVTEGKIPENSLADSRNGLLESSSGNDEEKLENSVKIEENVQKMEGVVLDVDENKENEKGIKTNILESFSEGKQSDGCEIQVGEVQTITGSEKDSMWSESDLKNSEQKEKVEDKSKETSLTPEECTNSTEDNENNELKENETSEPEENFAENLQITVEETKEVCKEKALEQTNLGELSEDKKDETDDNSKVCRKRQKSESLDEDPSAKKKRLSTDTEETVQSQQENTADSSRSNDLADTKEAPTVADDLRTDSLRSKRSLSTEKISKKLKTSTSSTRTTRLRKEQKNEATFSVLEKFRGTLKTLTRSDLEELIVQKLCEVITERSNVGELRRKAQALEQDQERWKVKVQSLTKQMREMEMVMKKYMTEVQKQVKDGETHPVTPLKVTRSVGLQVSFYSSASKNLKPNLSQSAPSSPAQNITPRTAKGSPPKLPTQFSPTNQNVRNKTTPPVQKSTAPLAKPVTQQRRSVVPKPDYGSPPTNRSVVQQSLLNNNRGVQQNPVPRPSYKPAAGPNAALTAQHQNGSKVIDLTDDDDRHPGNVVKAPGSIRVVNNLSQPPTSQNNRFAYLLPTTSAPTGTSGAQSRQVLIATPTMPQSSRQIMCSMPPLLFKGGNVVQSGSQAHIVNQSNKVLLPKALRHPAPLPQQPLNQNTRPNLKLLPPRPALKISKVQTGIVLSWNMSLSPEHAPIASYQLYAYQESNSPPTTSLWKKVGDVKALPLPMACTLTQFMSGHKYHFAVRAVDLHSRIGPFSFPGTIVLVK